MFATSSVTYPSTSPTGAYFSSTVAPGVTSETSNGSPSLGFVGSMALSYELSENGGLAVTLGAFMGLL